MPDWSVSITQGKRATEVESLRVFERSNRARTFRRLGEVGNRKSRGSFAVVPFGIQFRIEVVGNGADDGEFCRAE